MKAKYRILVYTDAFSGGGAEEVLNVYSSELRRDYNLIHAAKWLGPRDQFLPYWKLNLNKSSLRKSIFSIIIILLRFKPDVVFTSTGHNNVLFLILKILSFGKVKVVIRESSVASEMVGHANMKGKIMNNLVRFLYPMANKIITQSDDMTRDLIKAYNIAPKSLVKLNNPIVFPQTRLSKKYELGIINLLTIGRLSKEKGFSRLLKVMDRLPSKYHLSFMGQGQLKNELLEQVTSLGLENRVHFLGFLSGQKKMETIINSDIYIQTSYVEGFPNSLLECVYNGIPAFAFNVKGGTKEIISPVNGVLIVDGDLDALVNSILDFDNSKYSSKQMQLDLENRFGKKKVFQKLNNIFKQVVN